MSTLLRLTAIVVCAGLVFASQGRANDRSVQYRVTGIIVMPEKQIAVIEKSDATQQLYKPGQTIDQFTIARIDAGGVLLTQGGAEIYLELEGQPRILEDLAATSRTRELEVGDGNASQRINFASTRLELVKLMQPVPTAVSNDPDAKLNPAKKTLEQKLNMALGLPSYTVISSIDNRPVLRSDQALMALSERIFQGGAVRLEVGGSIPGVDVLYLTPDDE